MKKALKKEIREMLITSISITLNSVDEKAAAKISKNIDRAAERLTRKFGKKLRVKGKVKEDVKALVGKKKNGLEPVGQDSE